MLIRFLFVSLFLTTAAYADKFEKIIRSDEFQAAAKSARKHTHDFPEWLDPESDYAALFTEKDARERLLNWFPTEDDGYDGHSTKYKKDHDFIFASREYRLVDQTNLGMSIIVPHPGALQLAEQGLIPIYRKMLPQPGEIMTKENFYQDDQLFTMYQLKNKQMYVVTKLPQEVLVSFSVGTYKKVAQLRRFIDAVGYSRIKNKLLSARLEATPVPEESETQE